MKKLVILTLVILFIQRSGAAPDTVSEITVKLEQATEFSEIKALIQELANIGGDESADALIAQLGEKRTHAFHTCIVLEQTSLKQAFGPLTNSFWKCEGRGWRDGASRAAKAIGNTKAEGAYSFLTGVLDIKQGFYHHSYIRSGAAVGLGHLGDMSCVPRLIKMVEEGDSAEYGASEGLALLGAVDSADGLLKAFQDRGRPRNCRAAHVKALSSFDYRRSIPIFIEELKWDMENPDAPRMQMELEAIREHNRKYFDEDFVIYRLRSPLVNALVQFNDPRAIKVVGDCLIEAVQADEMISHIREPDIIEYLASQSDDQALDYLISARNIRNSQKKSGRFYTRMYEDAIHRSKAP